MLGANGTAFTLSRIPLIAAWGHGWQFDRARAALRERLAGGVPACLALAALALCTWLSFRAGQSFAFTGFLCLIPVVLTAVYGGFWQATVVSMAAVASLNYFFVPPIFSFVNSPANWVALGAFEVTALVISRLSMRAQAQAADADARRREVERLYETSRRILLLDRAGEPGLRIASLIREVFDLSGVQLFDANTAAMFQIGACTGASEQRAREAYFAGADRFDPETSDWCCVVRMGIRPVGGLALHGSSLSATAATALASLCGIALERSRALQRESHAQAARQAEQLRTAVLDALAHQFKTPLAIARTASSGLLAIGGLNELQGDLAASVDQQVKTLDQLASRLLTAARVECSEVRPQREPLLFSELARLAIQKLDQDAERRRFRVSAPRHEAAVMADRELMLISVTQLIDNALHYSEPGSTIDVRLTVLERGVVLRVRNKGLVVGRDEKEHIFERFYRAPGARQSFAGSGLGLSIVKKIVEAHRGSVWVEGEPDYGTSFSISLPPAR